MILNIDGATKDNTLEEPKPPFNGIQLVYVIPGGNDTFIAKSRLVTKSQPPYRNPDS
jgi:hypothetical protein